MHSRRVRSLLRVAAAWAVGLALLAWLTRDVPWRSLSTAVHPVPLWTVGATVAALLGSYLLRALRIQSELGERARGRTGACLRVMLVHNLAVNVLPMRGGEVAYPWLLHRRFGVPVAEAVASLVWIRAQDAIVLALLGVALWPGLSLGLRGALAAAIALGLAAGLALLRRFPPPPGPALPGGGSALRAALAALAHPRRHALSGWAFCAGSWALKLAGLASLLAGLAGLSPAVAAAGALGGELAGVLPLQGPAGFGTYEAGVFAGAALGGRSALEIGAPAVLVHLVALATAVVSGLAAHALSPSAPAPALENDHA